MDPGDHSDSESESDSDEEDLVDAKGFKLEVKKRQYEVEFSQTGGYGMALEPAGHKKSSLGAKVKRVQEESAADTSGKVKPGHFIMAIGSKDVTKSTVEAVNKALKRAPKPVTITFEVRVKHRIDSGSSGLDGAGAMNSEDARPSHVYLQREWTTHDQLTFEDYINVLTVCSSRLAHETELMKRIVFRIYDVDNDGFVGQDDLFFMFKFVTHGRVSDAQLELMVDHAFMKLDDSGDRKVNYDEFVEYMGDGAAQEFLEIDF
jgi:Ca2+-binding EF-hand superfamily protein